MLIVERGQGLANAVSYASLEDLENYASIRMGFEHISNPLAGDEIDADTKRRALVSTADLIDKVSFTGRKANSQQYMQWPRCGAVNMCEDCYNCIPSDFVPPEIVEANIILAALALKDEISFGTREVNPLVKSMKFDNQSIEFVSGARISGDGSECGGIKTIDGSVYESVEHLLKCFKAVRKKRIVRFIRG